MEKKADLSAASQKAKAETFTMRAVGRFVDTREIISSPRFVGVHLSSLPAR